MNDTCTARLSPNTAAFPARRLLQVVLAQAAAGEEAGPPQLSCGSLQVQVWGRCARLRVHVCVSGKGEEEAQGRFCVGGMLACYGSSW